MMYARNLVQLIVALIIFRNAAACGTKFFGTSNPDNKDNRLDSFTDYGYLSGGDPTYTVDCCGVVDSWEANFEDVTGTRTVYFQVWRPSGTSFELVGQNAVSTSSDGEQPFPIGVTERITIKSGDRWGWWSEGLDIITYKDGGGEDDNNYLMSQTSASVGDTVSWTTATVENERTYAVRMDVLSNDTPTFTVLPSTITIPATTANASSLHTVTVNDVNPYDISSLSVSMTTSTTKYSFDTSSNILTLASTLSGVSAVDTLVFEVDDQCSNTATATLTVSITNQSPTTTSLPAANSTTEDTTAETILHTIVTTDPEGSFVSCSMATSVPAAYPFTVKQISGSTSYGIYSDSSPGFNYTLQNLYTLTIDCTDGEYTDSEDFTVHILQNAAPSFLNLQNTTSVDAQTDGAGTNAFTVLVYDPEGDDLTFNMTCVPSSCPFEIFDSGEIQINQSLVNHTTVGYDLYITVSDGRNTVGPTPLTIIITGINDRVRVNNLPVTKVVVENTVIGTIVYDVNFTDSDTSQARVFTMTSSPSSGLSYFSIDSSTGEISVSTAPDYDILSNTVFVMTVVVSDPVTSDNGTVTIEITNVNEPPSFSQSTYTLSANESSAGTVIGTPTFGITDPDVSDSYTLTQDCGTETGYFAMNSTTGQVSFQSNYDLDTGSLPTTVTCTVTVTDAGGLTDTAGLTITIDYINDNTPVFSPASYTFYVSYYAAVGTSVGTVTATDADAGGDGVITYTLNQTSLTNEYFSIDNTGRLTVNTPLSGFGYSFSSLISSTASDVGGLNDTAIIAISISDTTTSSTTTTTESYKTFFDDTRNIAWFVICMILLIGCMILLGYIICTCHGANGCTSWLRNGRGIKNQYGMRKWEPRRDSSDNIHTVTTQSVRKPPPPLHSWKKLGV